MIILNQFTANLPSSFEELMPTKTSPPPSNKKKMHFFFGQNLCLLNWCHIHVLQISICFLFGFIFWAMYFWNAIFKWLCFDRRRQLPPAPPMDPSQIPQPVSKSICTDVVEGVGKYMSFQEASKLIHSVILGLGFFLVFNMKTVIAWRNT